MTSIPAHTENRHFTDKPIRHDDIPCHDVWGDRDPRFISREQFYQAVRYGHPQWTVHIDDPSLRSSTLVDSLGDRHSIAAEGSAFPMPRIVEGKDTGARLCDLTRLMQRTADGNERLPTLGKFVANYCIGLNIPLGRVGLTLKKKGGRIVLEPQSEPYLF